MCDATDRPSVVIEQVLSAYSVENLGFGLSTRVIRPQAPPTFALTLRDPGAVQWAS
jgi:hypothetical protein